MISIAQQLLNCDKLAWRQIKNHINLLETTLSTNTIFDLLEESQTLQYIEAKKAGYTDEEIIAYLSKSPAKKDCFDFVEVSWSAPVLNFARDFPLPFWSLVLIISICISWVSIRCVWKIIKLMLYQTVYTIFKAIKDAETVKK